MVMLLESVLELDCCSIRPSLLRRREQQSSSSTDSSSITISRAQAGSATLNSHATFAHRVMRLDSCHGELRRVLQDAVALRRAPSVSSATLPQLGRVRIARDPTRAGGPAGPNKQL